jgi:DNA adenine methylase
MASAILDLLPPHECYVEPFGGSGAVVLQKPPAFVDVWNDLDKSVVGFFQMLRDRPNDLIRVIQLTPVSRSELALAFEDCDDPLEKARRFYVRAWQSRGGIARWRSGWRYEVTASRGKSFVSNWNETYHLWDIVERLKELQLECDDAVAVIKRFDAPTTVFYVDPPYLVETRSTSHFVEYAHEMDTDGHVELAEVLRNLQGGVILSSYPNALYEELYADWNCMHVQTRTRSARQATEVLWMSPQIESARHPLFQELTGGGR